MMNFPKGKHMWTVKVGEKGQIVIPKEARDIFGFKSGDTLLILGDENSGIAIPPKKSIERITNDIYGKSFNADKEEE